MFELINLLVPRWLLTPVLKPIVRLILGLIAIPLFRVFVHRVARVRLLNAELEKDLEQWFRGSLMLLLASANLESLFFGWVRPDLREDKAWFFLATRLLLAVGVVESMPDQALFPIIHGGPPPLKLEKGRRLAGLRAYCWPFLRGLLCKHLSRSSPVLAILTAIVDGPMGWVFYGVAITQYLIIGLVTSRDRALDVLQRFDQAVRAQRDTLRTEQVQLAAEAGVATSEAITPVDSSGTSQPGILESSPPSPPNGTVENTSAQTSENAMAQQHLSTLEHAGAFPFPLGQEVQATLTPDELTPDTQNKSEQ